MVAYHVSFIISSTYSEKLIFTMFLIFFFVIKCLNKIYRFLNFSERIPYRNIENYLVEV